MSMLDDAADETKDAIKKSRNSDHDQDAPADRSSHENGETQDNPDAYDEDEKDTSGEKPVANLE